MKVRKKPVEIEAIEYDGDNLNEVFEFALQHGSKIDAGLDGEILIHTLNGTVSAKPGHWVLAGVNDELYPCAPAIFEKTYEAV